MPCLYLLKVEAAGGQGPDSIFVGAGDLNSEPQALSISLAFWFILSLFSDHCSGPCVGAVFLFPTAMGSILPRPPNASGLFHPQACETSSIPSTQLQALPLSLYFNNLYPHSQIIRGVLNSPLHWDTNLPELSTCQTPSNAARNMWDPETR